MTTAEEKLKKEELRLREKEINLEEKKIEYRGHRLEALFIISLIVIGIMAFLITLHISSYS